MHDAWTGGGRGCMMHGRGGVGRALRLHSPHTKLTHAHILTTGHNAVSLRKAENVILT